MASVFSKISSTFSSRTNSSPSPSAPVVNVTPKPNTGAAGIIAANNVASAAAQAAAQPNNRAAQNTLSQVVAQNKSLVTTGNAASNAVNSSNGSGTVVSRGGGGSISRGGGGGSSSPVSPITGNFIGSETSISASSNTVADVPQISGSQRLQNSNLQSGLSNFTQNLNRGVPTFQNQNYDQAKIIQNNNLNRTFLNQKKEPGYEAPKLYPGISAADAKKDFYKDKATVSTTTNQLKKELGLSVTDKLPENINLDPYVNQETGELNAKGKNIVKILDKLNSDVQIANSSANLANRQLDWETSRGIEQPYEYTNPTLSAGNNSPERLAQLKAIDAEEKKLKRVLSPYEQYLYLENPLPSERLAKAAELDNAWMGIIEKPIIGATVGVAGGAAHFIESAVPWKEYDILSKGGKVEDAIISYGKRNPLAEFTQMTGQLITDPIGTGGTMFNQLASDPFYEIPKFAGELAVFEKTTGPLVGKAGSIIKNVAGETIGTSRAIGVVAANKYVVPKVEPYLTRLADDFAPVTAKVNAYKAAGIELGQEFITDVSNIKKGVVDTTKKVTDPLMSDIYIGKQKLKSIFEDVPENLKGQYDLTLEGAKIRAEPITDIPGKLTTKLDYENLKYNVGKSLENKSPQGIDTYFNIKKIKESPEILENALSASKFKYENLRDSKLLQDIKSNLTFETPAESSWNMLKMQNIKDPIVDFINYPAAKLAANKIKVKNVLQKSGRVIDLEKKKINSLINDKILQYDPTIVKAKKIWNVIELEKTNKGVPDYFNILEPNRGFTQETIISNIRTPEGTKMSSIVKNFPSEFQGPAEIQTYTGLPEYITNASPSGAFVKGGIIKQMGNEGMTRGVMGDIRPGSAEVGYFGTRAAKNVAGEVYPNVLKSYLNEIKQPNGFLDVSLLEPTLRKRIATEALVKETLLDTTANKWPDIYNNIINDTEIQNRILKAAKEQGDIPHGSHTLNWAYHDFERIPGDRDFYSLNPKKSAHAYETIYRVGGKNVKTEFDLTEMYAPYGKAIISDITTGEKLMELERTVKGVDLYKKSPLMYNPQLDLYMKSPRETGFNKIRQTYEDIKKPKSNAAKDVKFLYENKLNPDSITMPESVNQNYIYYALNDQASLFEAASGKAKVSWGPSINITKGVVEKQASEILKNKYDKAIPWVNIELKQFFDKIENPNYKGNISKYVIDKATGQPKINIKTGKPLTIREDILDNYGNDFAKQIIDNTYYKELGAQVVPGTAAPNKIRAEYEVSITPGTELVGKTTTKLGKVKQFFKIPEQSFTAPGGQKVGIYFTEVKNQKIFTDADRALAAKRALTPGQNFNVNKFMETKEIIPKKVKISDAEIYDVYKKMTRESSVPIKEFYIKNFLKEKVPDVSLLRKSSSPPSYVSPGVSYSGASISSSISDGISAISDFSSGDDGSGTSGGSGSSGGSGKSGGSGGSGSSGSSGSSGASNSISKSLSRSLSGFSSLKFFKSPPFKTFSPSKNVSSSKKAPAFDVYVRGTGKGNKPVAPQLVEKGLPRNAALNAGMQVASRYAQRTVQLKPRGSTKMMDESLNRNLLGQYRGLAAKSKIKRAPINLVEKNQFAINTPEERAAIPYKAAKLAKQKSAFGSFAGMRI